MDQELNQSLKPSRARKSSPSKKKAKPALNARHMLYASGLSAMLTYGLTQDQNLSVVSSLCRLVPAMTSSGEITSFSTP